MTKLTQQQKKAIRKVTDALNGSDLSLTVSDIVNLTGLSQTVVKNSLAKIENIKQDDFGYYLPDVAKESAWQSVTDDGVNTQANLPSSSDNCQAPHASSPDNDGATLINTPAPLVNPTAEIVNPSGTNTDADRQVKHIMDEAKDAPYEKLIMPKKPRNKPFTPNPIMGYQVQKGKAKIFLDRRATSKTLTLSLADLKELVNAVEKSERVA